MKTAFNAKIIFESEKMFDYAEDIGNKDREFTFRKFQELINNRGRIDMECILDSYSNIYEPVIIIKQK